MKGIKSKFWGLLLIVFCCAFMAGCAGATVDTNLTVHDDGSGVRNIIVNIDSENFKSDFNGTYDDLNRAASDNCPEGMKYTFNQTDSGTTLNFDIEFSSVEEYNDKIHTIPGAENYSSEIIIMPKSVWGDGISIYEGFSSTDLLGWLSDALVDAGMVSEDNRSYIFETGKNHLDVPGYSNDTGEYYSYSNVSYAPLNTVYVYTEVTDFDKFNKSYYFDVSVDGGKERKDAIKKDFMDKVPKGVVVETTENSYYVTFEIEAKDLSLDAVKELDGILFPGSTFKETEGKSKDYFTFSRQIDEEIDLSSYICVSNQSISFNNYVKTPNYYELGSDLNYMSPFSNTSTDGQKPGYRCMIGMVTSSQVKGDASFAYAKKYYIESADYITKLLGPDKFEKTIVLNFSSTPSEEDKNASMDKLFKALNPGFDFAQLNADQRILKDGTGADECEVIVSSEGNSIKIYVKGSTSNVNEKIKNLTGYSDTLTYTDDSAFYKLNYKAAVDDFVYIDAISSNVEKSFKLNYTLDFGKSAKVIHCDNDKAVIEGGVIKISATSFNGTVAVAELRNTKMILILAGVVLMLILILVLILVIANGKKAKEKRAQKKAKPNAYAAAPDIKQGNVPVAPVPNNIVKFKPEPNITNVSSTYKPQGVDETPVSDPEPKDPSNDEVVCPGCGAKLKAGSRFCTECGHPV